MSRIRSWLGNMTFRFQMKRDESRSTKTPIPQEPAQQTTDPLSRSILEIMNKSTDKPPTNKPPKL